MKKIFNWIMWLMIVGATLGIWFIDRELGGVLGMLQTFFYSWFYYVYKSQLGGKEN